MRTIKLLPLLLPLLAFCLNSCASTRPPLDLRSVLLNQALYESYSDLDSLSGEGEQRIQVRQVLNDRLERYFPGIDSTNLISYNFEEIPPWPCNAADDPVCNKFISRKQKRFILGEGISMLIEQGGKTNGEAPSTDRVGGLNVATVTGRINAGPGVIVLMRGEVEITRINVLFFNNALICE